MINKKLALADWHAGFELEGTATRNGESLPVAPIIAASGDEGRALGLEGEAGLDQFEIHTPVLCRLDDAVGVERKLEHWADSVDRFFKYREVVPWFSPRSPFWRDGGVSISHMEENSRHRAMRQGFEEIYGPGVADKMFSQSAGHNALHVHLSHPDLTPDDFFSPLGVRLVNTFSPLADRFAREAVSWGDRCNLPTDYDRRQFWHLTPGRGPTNGPYTVDGLRRRWTSAPRLIIPDGTGGWLVSGGYPDVPEVLAHAYHGTLWETVRPSPARPDKPFTVEFRLWGAVQPQNIALVIAKHLVPQLAEIEARGAQAAA